MYVRASAVVVIHTGSAGAGSGVAAVTIDVIVTRTAVLLLLLIVILIPTKQQTHCQHNPTKQQTHCQPKHYEAANTLSTETLQSSKHTVNLSTANSLRSFL